MQQNDADLIHKFPNSQMSQLQQSLSQLKMKVSLSNYQMLQLTQHYDKFSDRLYELNQRGIQLLNNSQYQSSLIYFQQAQKLLQYAASCGITLERHFIISILHNEATAYQKLWDFQRAISYIQAITFNLASIVQSANNRQLVKKLQIYASPAENMSVFQEHQKKIFVESQFQNIKFLISKKFNLAKYYLQFSTLNSQNQSHQNALNYAKLSQKIIKQILVHSYNYLLVVQRLQNNQGKKLLQSLLEIKSQVSINQYDELTMQVTKVKECFDKKNVQTNSFAQLVQKYQKSKHQQSKIKQFSLGKIMELSPKSFDQKILETQTTKKYFYIQQCESYNNQLQKALYLSVAYFTISVQTKQLANQMIKQLEYDSNSAINQQKISQMYYILALKISIQLVQDLCHFTKYIYKNYCQTYLRNIKKSTQSVSKIDSLKQKYKYFLQSSSDSVPSEKQQDQYRNYQPQKQKKILNSKQKSKLSIFLKEEVNIKSQIPKLDVQLSQIQSIQYGGSINFSKNLNKKYLQLQNKNDANQMKKLETIKNKEFKQMQAFLDLSKNQKQILEQENKSIEKKQKLKSKRKNQKNKSKTKRNVKVSTSKSPNKEQKQIKKITSIKSVSPKKRVSKSQKKMKNEKDINKQINIYNSKHVGKQKQLNNDKLFKMNKVKSSKKQFQSMGLDQIKNTNSNSNMKFRLLRSNQILENNSLGKSHQNRIYFHQSNSNQKKGQKDISKRKRTSKQSKSSKSLKKINFIKKEDTNLKKTLKNVKKQ